MRKSYRRTESSPRGPWRVDKARSAVFVVEYSIDATPIVSWVCSVECWTLTLVHKVLNQGKACPRTNAWCPRTELPVG